MVAVLGAGVAALRIAAGLAQAGADVAVLAPDARLGAAHDALDLGLVTPGLVEHPHRLAAAIGEDGARALHDWTAANTAALGTHLAPRTFVRASAGRGEHGDIEADLPLLARIGHPAAARDPATVGAALGTSAFGAGHAAPGAGVVAPGPTLTAIARGALDAGARIVPACGTPTLRDTAAGVQVRTQRGALDADIVVLAGDWRMRDVDPWCADKVGPVRRHLARYAAPAGGAPAPVVLSSQHGWLRARIDPDGGLLVSGARWASPHFEMGESDPAPRPEVLAALDKLVAQRFPAWHAAGRTHAWASVAAHTCDQLPVVGPLPGRSGVVACFGWNGRPWSMAVRAADAVVEGLVHDHPERVTRWVQAHRFV
jgi:glycine/D-amino acid oxidase-like deaminating enzyme